MYTPNHVLLYTERPGRYNLSQLLRFCVDAQGEGYRFAEVFDPNGIPLGYHWLDSHVQRH